MSVLIEAGADVNATLNGELIPLHLAARYNRFHSVEMLLAAGADVNACTRGGCTALMAASETASYECAKRLLKSGVHINKTIQCNESIRNALTIHLESKDPKEHLVMLLFAAGEILDKNKSLTPNCLHFNSLNLKHLCREAIRKRLIQLIPKEHLFSRIPQLGLPASLTSYLLYYTSLNDDIDNDISA